MHILRHLGIGWVFTTAAFAPQRRIPPHEIKHLRSKKSSADGRIRQVGLRKSHKLVAGSTKNYFREDKEWTLAEGFAQQAPDPLARGRRVSPLLRESCEIPALSSAILHLDFRNGSDFDRRFRLLLIPLRSRNCTIVGSGSVYLIEQPAVGNQTPHPLRVLI